MSSLMIPSHRSALLTYFKTLAKRKYKLRCYFIANGSRTPPIDGLRNTVMNVLENLERYHYVIKRSETLDKKENFLAANWIVKTVDVKGTERTFEIKVLLSKF